MRVPSFAAAAALSLISTAAVAQQVDLNDYVNSNVSNYSGGSAYPSPGSAVVGGITFNLASFGGGTGVFNAFDNGSAAIAVKQTGVAGAYLIVNSAFGSLDSTIGSITFAGNGLTNIVSITEGINIRDHFAGPFNNLSSTIFATSAYSSGARFDVYRYALPASFNGILDRIIFTGSGTGFPQGDPFLAGITTYAAVSGVPEPATWAMLLIGFGAVGATMRTRRRNTPALV